MVSSLFSNASCKQFRRDPRDFSRGGALSPELLVTLLIYMVADGSRRGYQHLLDRFWDEARSFDLPLPTEDAISAPSFCEARPKITPELLKHALHQVATDTFPSAFGASHRWHGRQVFAVDGTKMNLQRGEELERAFGVPEGAYCPQVLVSVLLDVCAKAPVDVEVAPFTSSEREHLIAMLPSLQPGDVLVLDRGYPSHEVFQELDLHGLDFLVRVPSSHSFSAIDELRQRGGNESRAILEPPRDAPQEWRPVAVRLVRIGTPSGGETFFITSLKKEEFSREDLRELYHMRWEAEEFYKLCKAPYIGQGQFRSKSASGVRQEVHALVLYLAIARVIMATAAKVHNVDYEQLSQKGAVLGLADYVTRIFLANDSDYALDQLHALLRRIVRRRQRRRPNRSYPRVSFRPRLRWGPGGRCGG